MRGSPVLTATLYLVVPTARCRDWGRIVISRQTRPLLSQQDINRAGLNGLFCRSAAVPSFSAMQSTRWQRRSPKPLTIAVAEFELG